MALKINNDTYTPNTNFDSISVSGSYHTISRIEYEKIGHGDEINTTGQTRIQMKLYNNSGSYAANSSSYARLNHNVTIDWAGNVNALSASYEALKSQIGIYSGSIHVVDI